MGCTGIAVMVIQFYLCYVQVAPGTGVGTTSVYKLQCRYNALGKCYYQVKEAQFGSLAQLVQ